MLTHWVLCRPTDVIPFDQIWHHLYSTSAGGKHLSNDAQIRVIGRVEPEICTKMLKTLSEKLIAKFPATTPGCFIVKIVRLDDASLPCIRRLSPQYDRQSKFWCPNETIR